MTLDQILTNFGFSLNQAKIYLATLECGIGSAQEIGSKAGLKRTTAYSVLDELIRKNIVVKTKERGKDRFLAISPRELASRFAEYQQNLQEAIPQMLAIYNQKQIKPRVQFFEGLEGIKKIYADTLKEKPKEILEYNTQNIFQITPGFPKEYLKQRKALGIHAKRIGPRTPDYRRHQLADSEELSETKLLDTKEYNIPIEINIYNNKVALMSYNDKIGLIVESADIAKSMRTIYKLFWEKI
jgi:sugar-specific transcriptional regulator TrmB